MLESFLFGISVGFTSGFTPGPIWTLTVSQSIRYGFKEGIKVGIAPLITDAPIIFLSILLWKWASDFDIALAIISFLGSAFLFYLCYENFKVKPQSVELKNAPPTSLKKGIIANLLNPGPYLFWMTIGGPRVITYWENSSLSAILFVFMFYLTFIIAKAITAFIASKSVNWLKGKGYKWMIRILGIILALFGLKFIWDGLAYLGIGA